MNELYSLLIVEDERMEREALTTIVPWKELGFRVVGALRDGVECLEYLKSNVPDVILTDIRMTRMSGIELARFIQEQNLDIQVVFMSGHKEFEYARQAIELGVSHYLLKPLPLPKLREVFTQLRQKLDRRNHRDGTPATKYSRSVERVLQYIREHFNEDLTLNIIAEKLYLNPGYISRTVKEQTGQNCTDIIAEYRIQRAVWLLENTGLYVYEVAEQVGYKNLKYFYRIFKKYTGKAPKDYRSDWHEEEPDESSEPAAD